MPSTIEIIPPCGTQNSIIPTNVTVGRPGPAVECVSTSLDLEARSPSDGLSASARSALGIYGKNASPIDNLALLASRAMCRRFQLQGAARRLLPMEAVAGCLRRRQAGKDFVDLWYIAASTSAKFGGLQTCSSVWHCPVCAAKVTERRRVEVREGIDAWVATGGDIALVTFTVRHRASDSLRGLVAGLMRSLRRVSSGKAGGQLRSLYGVIGMIRSVEVTYGEDNGWHPHIHMLLFVNPECAFDLLWRHLRRQWDNALRLENMREVTARGVDMRWANSEIADYVAKLGSDRSWDIEHELVKGPVKLGRGEHLSPIELLAGFAETGDYEYGRLWQIYAHEMKGTHQLRWSPGLRARLGLGKVKTDAEISEEKDLLGEILARLNKKEWAIVLYYEARSELLNVAASGSAEQVQYFLWDLAGEFSKDSEGERRFNASLHQHHTYRDDQCEADAEELGLTRSEYLRWRLVGVDAMANPVQQLPSVALPTVLREYKPLEPVTLPLNIPTLPEI